jgi:hypothetical protein
MEKNNLQMIINDLRSRRDALSLAHENLKIESDNWNKTVIVISLMTGMLESIKLRMNWTSNMADLIPIALSSIIACVSALIKFKNFPSQMEILLQSQSLLTHTLTNARNEEEVTPNLLKEYHESLEKLEVSLYPDIRKKFLVQSHKNLISIMKQESKYFANIKSINEGNYVPSSDSSIESGEIELKTLTDNI